jgi:hypothetical protein
VLLPGGTSRIVHTAGPSVSWPEARACSMSSCPARGAGGFAAGARPGVIRWPGLAAVGRSSRSRCVPARRRQGRTRWDTRATTHVYMFAVALHLTDQEHVASSSVARSEVWIRPDVIVELAGQHMPLGGMNVNQSDEPPQKHIRTWYRAASEDARLYTSIHGRRANLSYPVHGGFR